VGLALVGDQLFSMGGFDGTTDCLSILECLDMSKVRVCERARE